MSSHYTATHKNGLRISLRLGDFPGCCGGRILFGYNVTTAKPPGIEALTPTMLKKAPMLHKQLLNYMRTNFTQSVLVAMDPVQVDVSGWSGGTVDSSCNDAASLQNFCLDNGFEFNEYSKGNYNGSRKLGVFSLGAYSMAGTLLIKEFTSKQDISITRESY